MGPDGSVLIIGVGSDYRSDDQVGLVVARALRIQESGALRGVIVLEQSGEGTSLMAAWQDAGAVILIDAMVSGAAPGSISRLDAREQSIPVGALRCSTHAFGVAEAIELARALNRLPPQVIVYAIEGESFDPGVELSPNVRQAAHVVVDRVVEEARGLLGLAL